MLNFYYLTMGCLIFEGFVETVVTQGFEQQKCRKTIIFPKVVLKATINIDVPQKIFIIHFNDLKMKSNFMITRFSKQITVNGFFM